MKLSVETWIALALLLVAGGAVATTFVPRGDHLEERCSPAIPPGDPVALQTSDTTTRIEGVLTRVVEFMPAQSATRLVARPCSSQDAHVVREEREPTLRIIVLGPGLDEDAFEDAVEIKARAVVEHDTLTIVPRIELRGGATLPLVRLELVAPANAQAFVEAWP